MRQATIRLWKAGHGGLLCWLFLVTPSIASAQDAVQGRALYANNCARCHSDPPGSGSINPLVRTADEIRAAINRVSPMKFLGEALSNANLIDVAAYFETVLGPPRNAPDFDVSGQWANATQPWWALYLTHYAGRSTLSGGWLTFDAKSNATWLYFHEAGDWVGPGIYTAKLFRNTGPAFATPAELSVGAPQAVEVGTIAFVFSDRETADVTFVLEGQRITHRIGRIRYPQ